MQEIKEPYRISDDSGADWAFTELAKNKKVAENLQKQADIYRESYNSKVDKWLNPQMDKVNDNISYFEGLIEDYRQTKPDGKVNVPSGKTSTRTTKKWNKDDKLVLSYVEANHPEFIKPTLNWADFKKTLKPVNGKAVDENGEFVEGIETHEETTVSYKPDMTIVELPESEASDENQ